MKLSTPALPAFLLAALLIGAIVVLIITGHPVPDVLTALAYVVVGVGGGVTVPGLLTAVQTAPTPAPAAPVAAPVAATPTLAQSPAPVTASAALAAAPAPTTPAPVVTQLSPETLAQITAAVTGAPAGSGVGVVAP